MRSKFPKIVEEGRVVVGPFASSPGDTFGAFFIKDKVFVDSGSASSRTRAPGLRGGLVSSRARSATPGITNTPGPSTGATGDTSPAIEPTPSSPRSDTDTTSRTIARSPRASFFSPVPTLSTGHDLESVVDPAPLST